MGGNDKQREEREREQDKAIVMGRDVYRNTEKSTRYGGTIETSQYNSREVRIIRRAACRINGSKEVNEPIKTKIAKMTREQEQENCGGCRLGGGEDGTLRIPRMRSRVHRRLGQPRSSSTLGYLLQGGEEDERSVVCRPAMIHGGRLVPASTTQISTRQCRERNYEDPTRISLRSRASQSTPLNQGWSNTSRDPPMRLPSLLVRSG